MASNTPPKLYHQNTTNNTQRRDLTYHLQIQTLQDLQWQYQWPSFSNSYPSPSTIRLHRQLLHRELAFLWTSVKATAIATFKSRIRCPRCHQLPLTEDTILHNTNHHLPQRALALWKSLMRECEVMDLIQLKQEQLDASVRDFWEIERLYWEDDGAGGECGLLAWNGTRVEPPLGG
jgi:hypothetical protein